MPNSARPLILSMGDPAGVGPELIAAAWAMHKEAGLPPFVMVGSAEILQAAAASRALDLPIAPISSVAEGTAIFAEQLPVLPLPSADPALAYSPGTPHKSGAQAALQSLELATDLAIKGEASALVTAPVAKQALAEVGFAFPGQTEFLSNRCGLEPDEAVMMLAGPSLRAVPLTVHCALSQVPSRISRSLIEARARTAAAALSRDFGIAKPRLAIAGLNPHAGEGGAFGDEEITIIAPAIAALQEAGINASGPYAADALFAPHSRSTYDAAICMYHDQALIPIKALDFDEGVNVTLGLPIIRTSPDHGTAFDIAGKNIANPGAMIAAIRMAGECAQMRAEQSRNG